MYSLRCDVYRKMAGSVDIESRCQHTAVSTILSIFKGRALLYIGKVKTSYIFFFSLAHLTPSLIRTKGSMIISL